MTSLPQDFQQKLSDVKSDIEDIKGQLSDLKEMLLNMHVKVDTLHNHILVKHRVTRDRESSGRKAPRLEGGKEKGEKKHMQKSVTT